MKGLQWFGFWWFALSILAILIFIGLAIFGFIGTFHLVVLFELCTVSAFGGMGVMTLAWPPSDDS